MRFNSTDFFLFFCAGARGKVAGVGAVEAQGVERVGREDVGFENRVGGVFPAAVEQKFIVGGVAVGHAGEHRRVCVGGNRDGFGRREGAREVEGGTFGEVVSHGELL